MRRIATGPRAGQEKGASLVEMALVLPLLMFLTISIVEVGMAFKDSLTAMQGVRDATRMLSAKGDDADADCVAIERLMATVTTTLTIDNIDRVEIFRADTTGNQVAGDTNTYTYLGGDPGLCDSWYGTIAWPPSSRQVVAGSTPLDIVGVRLVYDTQWVTGLPPYSGSYEIDRSTISRIEPEVFE